MDKLDESQTVPLANERQGKEIKKDVTGDFQNRKSLILSLLCYEKERL